MSKKKSAVQRPIEKIPPGRRENKNINTKP